MNRGQELALEIKNHSHALEVIKGWTVLSQLWVVRWTPTTRLSTGSTGYDGITSLYYSTEDLSASTDQVHHPGQWYEQIH